jgi:homoserine acetyltransferase
MADATTDRLAVQALSAAIVGGRSGGRHAAACARAAACGQHPLLQAAPLAGGARSTPAAAMMDRMVRAQEPHCGLQPRH